MSMMGLRLGRDGMDRMMPMHLVLDEAGQVIHAGPTLTKIAGGPLVARPMAEVLRFRRPYAAPEPASFSALQGRALQVELRRAARESVSLRAQLEPLPSGGALIQFAPGVRLARTVRDHGLDASDFSPIDAAVELLFMSEAQALIRGELSRLARSGGTGPSPAPARATAVPSRPRDRGTPALDGLSGEMGLGMIRVRAEPGTDPAAMDTLPSLVRAATRADDRILPLSDGVLVILPDCDGPAAAEAAAAHLRRHLHEACAEADLPRPTVDVWHADPVDRSEEARRAVEAPSAEGSVTETPPADVRANGTAPGDRAPDGTPVPPPLRSDPVPSQSDGDDDAATMVAVAAMMDGSPRDETARTRLNGTERVPGP